MTNVVSFAIPPQVPPVAPELLASAVFLFQEYLARLAAEPRVEDDDDEEQEEEDGAAEPEIDTAAVLDLFTEELGTGVTETLTLYMRITALYRLLATRPSLARLAVDDTEPGGALTEDALVAAARLDLHVARHGSEGSADFDFREFRDALASG